MWQSFSVKNFRCFRDLVLSPLARVNLIAGKNNTGKTALLEAMHVHSYPQNCRLPFEIHAQRGLGELPKCNEDVARWLFSGGQAATGLELASQNEKGVKRTLTVYLLDAAAAAQRLPEAAPVLKESFLNREGETTSLRIIMITDEAERKFVAVGVPTFSGLSSIGSDSEWEGRSIYLGSGVQSL